MKYLKDWMLLNDLINAWIGDVNLIIVYACFLNQRFANTGSGISDKIGIIKNYIRLCWW